MTPKEIKQKRLKELKSDRISLGQAIHNNRYTASLLEELYNEKTFEESELEKDLAVIEMREDEESELTPDVEFAPKSRFDGILEKGDDGRSLHQMKMDDINKLDTQQ